MLASFKIDGCCGSLAENIMLFNTIHRQVDEITFVCIFTRTQDSGVRRFAIRKRCDCLLSFFVGIECEIRYVLITFGILRTESKVHRYLCQAVLEVEVEYTISRLVNFLGRCGHPIGRSQLGSIALVSRNRERIVRRVLCHGIPCLEFILR